ncbi:hypothetical protein BYZ73_07100 [Rhodovulum viride]|uniref:Urease accessory protein UreE n=1 Tax=Rhodovulum viride TaxID=1231134 RepID=A0ABX9DIC1_9RHOB|nr:hypothetical protein BYZ73_07100 [Rhodovulum viride]
MSGLPVALEIRPGAGAGADSVTLDYDARFLRRKRLVSDGGLAFLLDLAHTTSLAEGDLIVLEDGRGIVVRAAAEPLLEVTGTDLARLAWHIGNRHTPCQVEESRLLIQRDHVLLDMLDRIGATVREVVEPFTPEGGAYGHGRTHGHSHGDAHGHTHDHAHDHAHDHGHGHEDGHGHGHHHHHDHGHAHDHTHGAADHLHAHDHDHDHGAEGCCGGSGQGGCGCGGHDHGTPKAASGRKTGGCGGGGCCGHGH